MEDWVAIRELAHQKVTLTEIARRTGHDPKTIRNVLRQPAPQPRPSTWKPQGTKLALYRDHLLRRVDQGCWNAVVLLEEIAAQGYAGTISILRDFLRPLRRERRRQQEAAVRFETGPGKQAQVDGAEFGRIWDPDQQQWRKLYAFVLTLGYSRALFLCFTVNTDLEHFLDCHRRAFAALGIPETLLDDNLKTAILGRRPDGSPVFPGRFLDFALYYGFTPHFCRPYRPRTKGKGERTTGYVRQTFWVRVMEQGALLLAGLNQRAAAWTTGGANVRLHATTGAVVQQRWQEEAPLLGQLEGRPPYRVSYRALRRVNRDGRFSYRGQLSQAPLALALGTLEVEEEVTGALAFRSGDGQAVRCGPVTAAPSPTPQPAAAAAVPEGTPDLLAALAAQAPPVPVRDLGVYQEAAQCSRF